MNGYNETDQLAFFKLLEEGFERATSETGVLTRDFAVAGRRLRLRFAGQALEPAILPAIEHLAIPTEGSSDFSIDLFDAHSTGTPLPFLAARFVDLLKLRWWEHLGLSIYVAGAVALIVVAWWVKREQFWLTIGTFASGILVYLLSRKTKISRALEKT